MGERGGTGWGGVEGWGENADNCNCIKINKFLKNDVHLSYHRSNINGPGTPRPLNRPKVSLSVPMTANGLPEGTDGKESNLQQNEDKNHRFVCD